jgi:hypothetical protein
MNVEDEQIKVEYALLKLFPNCSAYIFFSICATAVSSCYKWDEEKFVSSLTQSFLLVFSIHKM